MAQREEFGFVECPTVADAACVGIEPGMASHSIDSGDAGSVAHGAPKPSCLWTPLLGRVRMSLRCTTLI
jgi:hypothetical protein